MKRRVFAALSALLLALFTQSAQAEEQFKEYMFKSLPNYKIFTQKKNFNQLQIRSQKPESEDFTETTHEGNLVYTQYEYAGPPNSMPSNLQILRHYQKSVKKLEGEILCVEAEKVHASFTRAGKQYYMMAWSSGGGNLIDVSILEVKEMDDDTEIIDADLIIHKLEKEGSITLYINFDSGKATIKPESNDIIDEIATALKSRPQLKVKLEGHTDNVGNASANKTLSDDRAKAVMNAIAAKGIDKARLSAEGFGLEKPIADNNTEAGRGKNRRVELVRVQ
jgi:outer membrane protein OmpA-like peptidoglycan-associated protein